MRTKILLFLTVMGLSAGAQDYKMATLYEATGPVKEIKFGKIHPMSPKTIKFNPYGMSTSSTMTFDLDGFPIGCQLSQGDTYNSTTIEYNQDRQPSTIIDTYAMTGAPRICTISNSYANGLVESRVITETCKGYKKTITLQYSNQESDNLGNWITRTVTETTDSTNPKENGEKSYQEIRQISYFTPEEIAEAPEIPSMSDN